MELVEKYIDYKGLDRLMTRYYYAKEWDKAKNLYVELISMKIIPELQFDSDKWESEIYYKQCRPAYFQEDLLNGDIEEDKFNLVLTTMRVYLCFMGYTNY